MKLITKEIKKQLEKNAAISENAHLMPEIKIDHKPVLKLFSPIGAATWLLTLIKHYPNMRQSLENRELLQHDVFNKK